MIQAGAVELKEEQKDGKAKTNCQQIGQDIDTGRGTKKTNYSQACTVTDT